MFTRWAIRILIGIGFAFFFTLIAVMINAVTPTAVAQTRLPDDCNECHESVVINWEDSVHSQALADPTFQAAWHEQGSPDECLACHTTGFDAETGMYHEEGITCEACHAQPEGSTHHPEQVMPTNRSSEACGQCHTGTHDEWQLSQHGAEDLSCVRCHNPHTTNLKTESVQDVCIACHNEEAYFFAYTGHAEKGLLCTDCHLRVTETDPQGGHGTRDHTFAVDLTTCNECHEQEMHSAMQPTMPLTLQQTGLSETQQGLMAGMVGTGELSASVETAVTPCADLETLQQARNHIVYAAEGLPADPAAAVPSADPAPLMYLIPTALGLLLGVMISPVLERQYRRVRVSREENRN